VLTSAKDGCNKRKKLILQASALSENAGTENWTKNYLRT
jgi:hypothetical protein